MAHFGVKAAAVVGLPHERLGEQVAALIQVKPSKQTLSDNVLFSCLKKS